jgi:hypothetical protein
MVAIGAVALLVGLSALFALPVQLLWNGVAVNVVDGLHKVSFLHAWGLTLLSSFLFKSSK